jgi:hypothetical protein
VVMNRTVPELQEVCRPRIRKVNRAVQRPDLREKLPSRRLSAFSWKRGGVPYFITAKLHICGEMIT